MILALLLLTLGVFLSAFFSGSETGFYRVNRVRLLLDSLSGDGRARRLWWMTNRPALFVATTLVGNNLANYLVSLAIVMGASSLAAPPRLEKWLELLAPLALSPLLFVYGELTPKYVYYHAPNRLLRLGEPLFTLCGVLFAPVSAVLWLLSLVLQRMAGKSHPQLRLLLARRELQTVLEEGHEAGVLSPAQRQLAQGLFAVANQPVSQFATPAARALRVRLGTPKSEMLRLARRHRVWAIPIEEPLGRRKLIGYIRVAELRLASGEELGQVRSLMEIHASEPHIAALVKLHTAGETLARVVDNSGATVGLVSARQLSEPLLRGA